MLSPEGIMPAQQVRPGHRRPETRIILLTLIAAITVDKVFVSRELPEVSAWVSINPMPVFLDIPADLSLDFGLVPVSILFILLYGATLLSYRNGTTPSPYRSGNGPRAGQCPRPSLWRASTALLIVPCSILSGSLLYRLIEDQLSKQVRNAIASFGVTADIHSFLPGHEFIHLRGSMVMFVFLFPGLYLCIRRIRGAAPAARITNTPIREISKDPILVMSNPAPAPIPAQTPRPLATPCTETAPVTVSPVRIHVQYPNPRASA